jgi:hypothetical protein
VPGQELVGATPAFAAFLEHDVQALAVALQADAEARQPHPEVYLSIAITMLHHLP